MAYKFCPNCFSASYSQSEHKIWLCPVCGKDISFMPSLPAPPEAPNSAWITKAKINRQRQV